MPGSRILCRCAVRGRENGGQRSRQTGAQHIRTTGSAISHSERVPKALQERFESLWEGTDAFCVAHLNEECRQMIRFLLAALCHKRPSPLTGGKAATWAAVTVHAIGTANFLFDSTQTAHCRSPEISCSSGSPPAAARPARSSCGI